MSKNKTYIIFRENELIRRKKGQWSSLVNKCGIYAFLKNDEVLYVGRSKNLYKRLISHYGNGGICNFLDFDEIVVVFTEDYKSMEKSLIKKIQPQFNGRLTSRIYKR